MIIELLFDLLYGLLGFIIDIMPSILVPDSLIGGVTGFIQMVKQLEFFLPVSTLFVVIGAIIMIDVFMWGVWVANWLVHRIPIVG